MNSDLRFHLYFAASVFLLLFPACLMAQVNGPGPSDPSLFTNVFSVPADVLGRSLGGVPEETTQLNVMDGGSLPSFFQANSGSEVNISGGSVGSFFQAGSGSEVTIGGELWEA